MGSAIHLDEFYNTKNPLDVMERLADQQHWAYSRTSVEEMTLAVEGTVCDYHISLNWREDLEALHMACAFEFKVPEDGNDELYKLIAHINEQLWIGHFDLWSGEGLIMFRHALMLNNSTPSKEQCEALLQTALEQCEKYYQAFQFVINGGHSAPDAMASVMFETQGCA